jgi:hypothetical protein
VREAYGPSRGGKGLPSLIRLSNPKVIAPSSMPPQHIFSISFQRLRSCLVSCRDLAGTEHAVEVTAESLFEAVAQALGIMLGDQWVEEIGEGLMELKVRVKQPAVEHRVRMKNFRRWLESQGKTPAECTGRGS